MSPAASPPPSPGVEPGADPAPDGRPGPVVRALDGLTGLLAGGMLVLGVVLALAQLVAPAVLSAAGWGVATGPGWGRVVAHLVVGGAGEAIYRTRARRHGLRRVLPDLAVVVAAVVVIAVTWWP